MRVKRWAWSAGALALVLAGCGPQADRTAGSSLAEEEQPAPEIELPLKHGAPPMPLSAWKGKVVILDFWATWCGPCRESIPEIERIYKKYHARGLEVVGISKDQDDAIPEVARAMKKMGVTYPVVLFSEIAGIESKYEFPTLPQMYIINRKGLISQSIEGYGPGLNLDAKVEALVNEKG